MTMSNEYPKVMYIGDLGESRVVNDETEEKQAREDGYGDTIGSTPAPTKDDA